MAAKCLVFLDTVELRSLDTVGREKFQKFERNMFKIIHSVRGSRDG